MDEDNGDRKPRPSPLMRKVKRSFIKKLKSLRDYSVYAHIKRKGYKTHLFLIKAEKFSSEEIVDSLISSYKNRGYQIKEEEQNLELNEIGRFIAKNWSETYYVRISKKYKKGRYNAVVS